MIRKVNIYDMDGTIVCSLHRYRTLRKPCGTEAIDLPFWRANEHRAMFDSLLPLAEQYRQDLKCEDTFVIIATARIIRRADMQFIREVLGVPDALISRRDDADTRSGGDLKIEGLAPYLDSGVFSGADVTFFEDNVQYLKKVCDRFNIRGVYVPSQQGH